MSKFATLSERKAEEEAVSSQTVIFLKSVQMLLKQKGFVRTDARNVSAMFVWDFKKGNREIQIVGWHGTGRRGTNRWYGDLKAVLTVFDNKPYIGTKDEKYRMHKVVDMDILDGTVADHTKLLVDATNYIVKV